MKSKCLIGLLFFCVTSLTAQSGKAIYSKELTSLNNDISNLSLKQKSYRKQILKNLQNWNYQLDFNNKKASYAKQESLHIKTNPVINAMTLGFANFSGSIYFDTEQDIVLNIKEFDGEKYIIKKNKINWTLSKDTLQIDNYLCYKATTIENISYSGKEQQIKIIAWYSPEISLSFGPDGYAGLPGIIMKLEKNGTTTTLKQILFSKNNTEAIIKPSNGKVVTEDEFNKITSSAYNKIKNK